MTTTDPQGVPAGVTPGAGRRFGAGARRVAAMGWRASGRVLTRLGAWLAHLWRSSLQFKVVLTTVVLCAFGMAFLQSFIYQRIAEGLVDGRVLTARGEADYAVRYLVERAGAVVATEDLDSVSYRTLQFLASAGEDNNRQLILTRSLASTGATTGAGSGSSGSASRLQTLSTGPALSVIPQDLREAVANDPAHQQVVVARVPAVGGSVPAVIVGTQVTLEGNKQDLYAIFALNREEKTLTMVRQTFVLGSVIFALLIGLISYVVTRMVVDPVRQAAVVAGRLSSGHLNERMHARGEDDLATLATSFNDMADHLQAQISQLEDLSALQQRFVSDVSHELRTPLTTIRMASEIIHDERAEFSPVVARSAELLYGEVDRFEALLADLLEISRFDAGAAQLARENTDLTGIVDSVIASCLPLAERRGSAITLHGIGSSEPRAEVDYRRIERVLRNLLVNAIEHAEGGPVHVEIASNESAVAIAVRDFGVGLRPGEADLVFNRFWRADPARKRTTGGTGLGLSIAMEDVRLHDGMLDAWGEPGHGARFRLVVPKVAGVPIGEVPLPLEDPAPEPPPAPAAPVLPVAETVDLTHYAPHAP